MLYYCVWKGEDAPDAMIVDAKDAANAKDTAASLSDEPPPDVVTPIGPGRFAVHVEQLELDGDLVWAMAPVEDLSDLIDEMEEAAEQGADAPAPGQRCGSVARDDSEQDVQCERTSGHPLPHQGGGWEW